MKKIRFTAIFMTVAILLTTVPALAAAPGSSTDPLISKSYMDGNYCNQIMSTPLTNLQNAMIVLRYKLNHVHPTGTGINYHNVTAGNSVSLKSGSELSIVSGSLVLSASNGTVIDVTDGNTVASGQNLKERHHYILAANTSASFSVLGDSKLSLCGDAKISGEPAIQFSDVKDWVWFYEPVYYSVQKGLINGRSSTIFDPNGNITIAETIKLASCLHQLYNTGMVSLRNGYPWYSTYVSYAESNGIISKAYSNYDAKITRDEFVHIFYSALPTDEYKAINSVASDSIPDIKTGSNYSDEIYTFYRAGILTGVNDTGAFKPNNNILRCEVSAIVMRMLESDARRTIN